MQEVKFPLRENCYENLLCRILLNQKSKKAYIWLLTFCKSKAEKKNLQEYVFLVCGNIKDLGQLYPCK